METKRNLNLCPRFHFINKPLGTKCVKMCMRIRNYIINTRVLKMCEILFIGQHLKNMAKVRNVEVMSYSFNEIEYTLIK